MSYKPNKITVVGAGLVGSLVAVMLGKRGYQVEVLESRPDMRKATVAGGRSINLALSKRGIHALSQAGLMEQVKPLLIPMGGRMLHLDNEEPEFSPYGQRPHEQIYSVSRMELNRLMMTAAEAHPGVEVLFEQRCREIDFHDNRVVFETPNGRREISFEMLIGTDGAGSQVRQAMLPAAGGDVSIEYLGHDYKELEIPAGPNGEHQIEREALHIWPRGGFMLIALPNLDGSFTVTLFLPKRGEFSFANLETKADVLVFFETHFPTALQWLPNLANEFFENPTGRLGTVRCAPWHFQNDALLLGDAAHAIVPFHGQGMNSGFEDGAELLRLLDQFDDDWEQVLPEMTRIRKPAADAIADMALENYITMRDSVREEDFQLKKELGFELEERFPNRFIPRYSMVMFHRIPYDQVQQRGEIQDRILNRLLAGKTDLVDVDYTLAEIMIDDDLPPLHE